MALSPKEGTKSDSFAAAVIFAVLGSFFISFAFVTMKIAHVRRESGNKNQSILRTPLWWGGFLMGIIGNCCNIAALAAGNVFLLSTTCCISIIFNTIFCVILLKEKLYLIRLVALVIIMVGTCLFLSLGKNLEEIKS